MKVEFADTSYYLALLNPADESHGRAAEHARRAVGRTVTTAWVLSEVVDALSRPALRPIAVTFVKDAKANPRITVAAPSQELFDAGMALFEDRPDKEWSLTDRISFVVMEREGLKDALTTDHHFEQAGFNVLLR